MREKPCHEPRELLPAEQYLGFLLTRQIDQAAVVLRELGEAASGLARLGIELGGR